MVVVGVFDGVSLLVPASALASVLVSGSASAAAGSGIGVTGDLSCSCRASLASSVGRPSSSVWKSIGPHEALLGHLTEHQNGYLARRR